MVLNHSYWDWAASALKYTFIHIKALNHHCQGCYHCPEPWPLDFWLWLSPITPGTWLPLLWAYPCIPEHISVPLLLRLCCHCPEPHFLGPRSRLLWFIAGAAPHLQGHGSEPSFTGPYCHCSQPSQVPTNGFNWPPLELYCSYLMTAPWGQNWDTDPPSTGCVTSVPWARPVLYLVILKLMPLLGHPTPVSWSLSNKHLCPQYWFHRDLHTHTLDTTATASVPVLQDTWLVIILLVLDPRSLGPILPWMFWAPAT